MNAQKRDMRYEARPPGIGADLRARGSRYEIREMNAPRPGREVGERDRRSRCEIRDAGRAVPGDFHECWPMRGQM